jgi:hypothetical protein
MTQTLADSLKQEFLQITGISVEANFLSMGASHQPSSLPIGMQGVYVFLTDAHCFKVGKAGPKSKARWNSHHYNLDETTPSAFTKSIVKNKPKFKEYFAHSQHSEIDQLEKGNIGDWIRSNISRIEFLLPESEGRYALSLLEALVQFRLKPKYEGRDA